MLHKNQESEQNNIVSKEGQRGFLCSNNKSGERCPSLGIINNPTFATEADAIDYLAKILVDIYLK